MPYRCRRGDSTKREVYRSRLPPGTYTLQLRGSNRDGEWSQSLQIALTKRDDSYFTLLLIDLDDFKKINDTFGHDAGDALLVETALRLNAAVREADRVARRPASSRLSKSSAAVS